MLSIDEVLSLLRVGADIRKPPEPEKDEEGNEIPVNTDDLDSDFLYLSDEELTVYIKLGMSRGFPEYSFEDLPDGAEYGVYLLAKIELYTALAVKRSDTVDMGVDNNTYLKGSQKFDHFMKLAEDAKQQYDDWLENEGADILGIGVVSTYNMLIDNTRYGDRNRLYQPDPSGRLKITPGINSVEFYWNVSYVFNFQMYKVYFSEEPIVDMFADGNLYSDKVNKSARAVMVTHDIRNTFHRLEGLKPETTYYIAVMIVEQNNVFGYVEKSFTTLEEPEEEPDISIGDITDPENPDPDEGEDNENKDTDPEEGEEDKETSDEDVGKENGE